MLQTVIAEPTTPPRPELFRIESPRADAANPWSLRVESVALHAEKGVAAMANKRFPVCARSPFRTGTIHFSPDGVVVEGMAPLLPPRWFALLPLSGMFAWFWIQIANGVSNAFRLSFGGRMALFLAVISPIGVMAHLQSRHDKKRIETKLLLSWESVRGVLVDEKLRTVTLVYTPMGVVPKSRSLVLFHPKNAPSPEVLTAPSEFILLQKLSPVAVAAVAETVTHYAPHAHRETTGKTNTAIHWLTVVLIAVVAAGLVFAGLVILYIQYRRLTRP